MDNDFSRQGRFYVKEQVISEVVDWSGFLQEWTKIYSLIALMDVPLLPPWLSETWLIDGDMEVIQMYSCSKLVGHHAFVKFFHRRLIITALWTLNYRYFRNLDQDRLLSQWECLHKQTFNGRGQHFH